MTTRRPWRAAVVLAASWLVGWSAIAAQASEIRDDAGLFSPAVVTSATESLKQLEEKNHVSVQIETHQSVPESQREAFGKLPKTEWARFYQKWVHDRRVATQSKNGLFVLITKSPGHVEYHVADDLKRRGFEKSEESAFLSKFLDGFKTRNFDEGLKNAVGYLSTVSPELKAPNLAPQGYHPRPVQRTGQTESHREVSHEAAPVVNHIGNNRWSMWTWIILGVAIWLVFRLIIGMTRSAGGGMGPNGQGYGGGYPAPGYGGGGYGYGGGGGGFMGNMMGGLFGAMAGNWMYNNLFGASHHSDQSSGWSHSSDSGDNNLMGDGYTGSSSNDDYGGGSYGGGDFDSGSGGFGGGDFGGGDFSGGDFGGGDSGGGDF